jgi:hypothetical protein
MRINLKPEDFPKVNTTTSRAVPIETLGQIICDFKSSIEYLHKSLEVLIEEVKGLRTDIKNGINKTNEGLEMSDQILDALKNLE